MKEFIVHEYYAYRSEFFRCAMNGNWAEASSRLVNMPEDDPEQFSLYVRFLYTGKIATDDTGLSTCRISPREALSRYHQLAKIYTLAEQLQDTTTKNAAVRGFYTIYSSPSYPPPPKIVNIIYLSTPATSVIRRMLVDMWCANFWSGPTCTQDEIDSYVERLPQEFLARLLGQLGKQRNPALGSTAMANGVEEYLEKE